MKVRQKKTLAILIMFLAAIIVSVFGAQSLAKYVFSFQQEAIGHYVDYRLHHDGDGKSAIVENIGSPQNYGSEYSYDHVGFITLKVDNFLEEDGTVNISQREISFTLRTPTKDELVDGKVTDAWQEDTPIKPLSAYYEVSVVGEFGNELAVDSDEYKQLTTFPEREKKSSYITLMIKRRTTSKKDNSEVPSLSGVEDISIIISTTLPYIDVEVFTISLTNRLMMISSTELTYFGFDTVDVNVKTANMYKTTFDGDTAVYSSSYNVMVKFSTTNVTFDEERFKLSTYKNYTKLASDPNDNGVDFATIFNKNSYYIKNGSGNTSEITLFIPAASSVTLNFYLNSLTDAKITVKAYFLFNFKEPGGSIDISDSGGSDPRYDYTTLIANITNGLVFEN